jgi:tetratricopeptide (TPR) repeat protein
MLNYNSFGRRVFAKSLLAALLLLLGFAQTSILAQQQQPPPEWKRALELYEAQNFVAALPLLEKIAESQPENPMVLSRLGFAIYAVAETEKDPDRRKKMLDRARQILLKSQSLGDNSNLTQIALDGLSGGGALTNFSQIRSADTAMREGEAAFVRGDLDVAIDSYKRALELDPKLYSAAVFAGDSEYKKGYLSKDPDARNEHFVRAGNWFARAVAIDANRETAYRYWGDTLNLQGKALEARDKFVEAIVAEPYGRKAYVGLQQWANDHKVSMAHPDIVVPAQVSSGNTGDVKITVDDSALKASDKDGTAAWVAYGLMRATWMPKKNVLSERFAKAYPGETEYRHSLAEEVDALRMVAESLATQLKEKKISELNPSLANLIRLKEAGLLEAYVLFARVDQGIARDYAAYRISNRDKLKRYWLEIVIPKE